MACLNNLGLISLIVGILDNCSFLIIECKNLNVDVVSGIDLTGKLAGFPTVFCSIFAAVGNVTKRTELTKTTYICSLPYVCFL